MNEENKAPVCKPCEDCEKKELTNEEQEQVTGGWADCSSSLKCALPCQMPPVAGFGSKAADNSDR